MDTRSGIPILIRNMSVQFEPLDKKVGAQPVIAVRDLSIDVREGEIVALVGPSGCGKTTILNVLAGFLPYAGQVLIGEEPPGRRRDIGYLFQRDALLPWRTLASNAGFALEVRGVGRKERQQSAVEMLELLGLSGFVDAFPQQVSGGMAKRAALAQAVMHRPSILLLDEPFGALDAFTRAAVENDLLRLLSSTGATAMFVTHNLQEAISLSDRVVILSARPASVVSIHDIDLPRPRVLPDVQYTARFAELEQDVWNDLRREIL